MSESVSISGKVKGGRGVFISATDTDVGKTMLTCALARELRKRQLSPGVMKPVSAGGVPNRDALELMAASGVADPLELVNPCAYHAALAPLVAAERDGLVFDRQLVLRCAEELAKRHALLLIEGAGGLLVPLGTNYCLLDLMQELGYPVLLVCRAGLGTVNHTLMSLELIRARKLPVLGVILNGAKGEEAEKDNPRMIEEFGKCRVLATVPFLGEERVIEQAGPYLAELADSLVKV
jgi:dethiobiotin synthetase